MDILLSVFLKSLTGQLFNPPERENHALARTCQSQEFSNTPAHANAGIDKETSKIDEKYKQRIADLEMTVNTLSTHVSQFTQLNTRLNSEIGELKVRIEKQGEQIQRDSELLVLLLEAAKEKPDLLDELLKRKE